MLTFLVLIGTSTTLFYFLKCQEFDEVDPPQSFLIKDYSIDCNSDRYAIYKVYAIGMICVYPVGIPLLYLSLLLRHRDTLSDPGMIAIDEANGYASTGHLLFLTDPYKPEAYYFEVPESVRRLLLASVVGIVSEDSVAAPVMGNLIALAFTEVIASMRPFASDGTNTLMKILSYSLVMIFLGALLIKVDATSDSKSDQAVFGALLSCILLSGPSFLLLRGFLSKFFDHRSRRDEETSASVDNGTSFMDSGSLAGVSSDIEMVGVVLSSNNTIQAAGSGGPTSLNANPLRNSTSSLGGEEHDRRKSEHHLRMSGAFKSRGVVGVLGMSDRRRTHSTEVEFQPATEVTEF
jgi:hypothetical protein